MLNRDERRILKSIAKKIIESTEKKKYLKLNDKESQLYRKLAMYYDVDPNTFKEDWIKSFPNMTDEEADETMMWAFNGLDNKISDSYKD